MKGEKGENRPESIVKMKIWQPLLSMSNFKISRDETLNNKPIIFVRKHIKTQHRNIEFQNFPGRTPGGGEGKRNLNPLDLPDKSTPLVHITVSLLSSRLLKQGYNCEANLEAQDVVSVAVIDGSPVYRQFY
jgi:hypothetical protein